MTGMDGNIEPCSISTSALFLLTLGSSQVSLVRVAGHSKDSGAGKNTYCKYCHNIMIRFCTVSETSEHLS